MRGPRHCSRSRPATVACFPYRPSPVPSPYSTMVCMRTARWKPTASSATRSRALRSSKGPTTSTLSRATVNNAKRAARPSGRSPSVSKTTPTTTSSKTSRDGPRGAPASRPYANAQPESGRGRRRAKQDQLSARELAEVTAWRASAVASSMPTDFPITCDVRHCIGRPSVTRASSTQSARACRSTAVRLGIIAIGVPS